MSDPTVDRWRLRGRVALWRNRHVWQAPCNLSADADGSSGLIELIDLMAAAKWPSRKTIPLHRVRVTGDHGGESPFRVARVFDLRYPKERVADDHWELSSGVGIVTLVVGAARLAELRDAVDDLSRGGGDYSIGPDGVPDLWVWWWVEA